MKKVLVYNNKEYRSLQEQVQKNKADIEDWNAKEDTLANFGIRIIGRLDTVEMLDKVPTQSMEYGDCYMIGVNTYEYYVWTRPTNEVKEAHWQNIGKLSVRGPEGPKGDEIVGSTTTVGDMSKAYAGGYEYTSINNKIAFKMSDGRTINVNVVAYGKEGPKGKTGLTGNDGEKGDKGDPGKDGPQGPQGEIGPTAVAYHIVGVVSSVNQLPEPKALDDLTAAYILDSGSNKELYTQVGKTTDDAKWTNLGSIGAVNYWETNGSILAPVEAVDTVQINNLAVLQSASLVSPSIQGVASVSGLYSPATMDIDGVNGVEISGNGTTQVKITENSIALPNIPTTSDHEYAIVTDGNKLYKSKGIVAYYSDIQSEITSNIKRGLSHYGSDLCYISGGGNIYTFTPDSIAPVHSLQGGDYGSDKVQLTLYPTTFQDKAKNIYISTETSESDGTITKRVYQLNYEEASAVYVSIEKNYYKPNFLHLDITATSSTKKYKRLDLSSFTGTVTGVTMTGFFRCNWDAATIATRSYNLPTVTDVFDTLEGNTLTKEAADETYEKKGEGGSKLPDGCYVTRIECGPSVTTDHVNELIEKVRKGEIARLSIYSDRQMYMTDEDDEYEQYYGTDDDSLTNEDFEWMHITPYERNGTPCLAYYFHYYDSTEIGNSWFHYMWLKSGDELGTGEYVEYLVKVA